MPETGFASSIPRFDHGKPKDWFTARFLKNHVAINVSTGKRKAEETFLRRKAVGIPQACHELEAFARPHRIRIDLTMAKRAGRRSRRVEAVERAIRVIEKAMASKSAGEQEAWKRLRKQFLENLSPPSASTLLDLDVKQAVRLAGECHRMQVDLEASLGHPLDEHVRLKNRQTLHKYPYWQRGASLKRSTRRFGRLVIGYKFVGDRVRINHLHSVK